MHEPSTQHVCQSATVNSFRHRPYGRRPHPTTRAVTNSPAGHGTRRRVHRTPPDNFRSESPWIPRRRALYRAMRAREAETSLGRNDARSRASPNKTRACSVKRKRERKKGNAGGADLDEAAAASRKERPRRQKPPPRTASSLPNHSSREMVPQSSLDTSLGRRAREVRCFTLKTNR